MPVDAARNRRFKRFHCTLDWRLQATRHPAPALWCGRITIWLSAGHVVTNDAAGLRSRKHSPCKGRKEEIDAANAASHEHLYGPEEIHNVLEDPRADVPPRQPTTLRQKGLPRPITQHRRQFVRPNSRRRQVEGPLTPQRRRRWRWWRGAVPRRVEPCRGGHAVARCRGRPSSRPAHKIPPETARGFPGGTGPPRPVRHSGRTSHT